MAFAGAAHAGAVLSCVDSLSLFATRTRYQPGQNNDRISAVMSFVSALPLKLALMVDIMMFGPIQARHIKKPLAPHQAYVVTKEEFEKLVEASHQAFAKAADKGEMNMKAC